MTLQYLTVDGWQWVMYEDDDKGEHAGGVRLVDNRRAGMMPVAQSEYELLNLLREYGWEVKGLRRVERMGKSFQCRTVFLKPY